MNDVFEPMANFGDVFEPLENFAGKPKPNPKAKPKPKPKPKPVTKPKVEDKPKVEGKPNEEVKETPKEEIKASVEENKTDVSTLTAPEEKKIFGMPKKVVIGAGIGLVILAVAGYFMFKKKKKK